MNDTRFVIEDAESNDASASSEGGALRRAARWSTCVELLLLLPGPIRAVLFTIVSAVALVVAAPLVVFGALLLVQAPVFFLLWRLLGATRGEHDAESPA